MNVKCCFGDCLLVCCWLCCCGCCLGLIVEGFFDFLIFLYLFVGFC